MDDDSKAQADKDLSKWFSTYGLVTVERIFAQLGLHLKPDELKKSMDDPTSIFYQILRVPFKNILNGIILNQAQDYREYAQKLFVDYLMSGAANEPDDETQGADARETLEQLRNTLISMGDECDIQEFEHNKLIAVSQKDLIAITRELNSPTDDQKDLVKERMSSYDSSAQALNEIFRQYRREFHNIILEVRALLEILPDYRPDPQKTAENIALLQFDSEIGG